jgi:hypothetical protein
VPDAEVEIEYMNFPPDMKKNAFAKKGNIEAPSDHFITMVHKTDANGVLTFTPPFGRLVGHLRPGFRTGQEVQGQGPVPGRPDLDPGRQSQKITPSPWGPAVKSRPPWPRAASGFRHSRPKTPK